MSVAYLNSSNGWALSSIIWSTGIYIYLHLVSQHVPAHYTFLSHFPAHCRAIKNKSRTTIPTYVQGGNGEAGARLPHVILVICSH